MLTKEQQLIALETHFDVDTWRAASLDFRNAEREWEELTEPQQRYVDTVVCWLGRLASSAQELSLRLYVHPEMNNTGAFRKHLMTLAKHPLCVADWWQATAIVAHSLRYRGNFTRPLIMKPDATSWKGLLVTYSAIVHIIGATIAQCVGWMKERQKVPTVVKLAEKMLSDYARIQEFLVLYGQVYYTGEETAVHEPLLAVYREFAYTLPHLVVMEPLGITKFVQERTTSFCDLWQVRRIVFSDTGCDRIADS